MDGRALPAIVAAALLCAPAAVAGDPPQKTDAASDDERSDEGDVLRSDLSEQVVVSASATGVTALDAPAAVDVLEGEELERRPGGLVDHLRRVPGINVVQFSARDVNVSPRSATGGINTSTLAVADGRNLHQDFLGIVLWEFAPTDFSLIDRVEIVRGPASSLWGANAVGGIVQVITKSPRETLGGKLELGAGSYDSRDVEFHQSFLAGDWALRLSAGYRENDAYDRPETIENLLGETKDPDLGLMIEDRDSRTEQPRVDLRADWRAPTGGEWILQGGWGKTRGWIATGIGPFDIDPSTANAYLQARYRQGPYEAQVVGRYFDGEGLNLINEIDFGFRSTATEATFKGRHVIGRRAVLGWGLGLEHSTFDLNIAPGGDERSKGWGYAEADVELASRWKLIAGGRLDYVRETIKTVLSPRAALRYKPKANQTLRLAWGRAFRSPSVIETDLLVPAIPVAELDWELIDQQEVGFPFFALMAEAVCSMQPDNCGAPPGEIPDYIAVTGGFGSRDLEEVTTDSIELGYAAQLGRFGLSATVYQTRTENGIDFPVRASYGSGADGLPGTADDVLFPTDPDGDGIDEAPAVDVCFGISQLEPFDVLCQQGPVTYNHALALLLDGRVPAAFQYANSSKREDEGFELGVSWVGPHGLSSQINYSWQDVPESGGEKMSDRIDVYEEETAAGVDLDGDGEVADFSEFVNIPAKHRASFGFQVDRRRWFGSISYDWIDRTFWQDVLTPEFWGYVESHSLVGLRGGWRWPGRGLQLTAEVTNLLDDPIQQHIYADIIDRRASLALSWAWKDKSLPRAGGSR